MADIEKFKQAIASGYDCKGDYIVLGAAMLDGAPVENALVKVPLKTLNRHGLIAGATGTGKTKTLQGLAEQLSDKGISVLVMDIKGDFSGIAMPGTNNPKIEERQNKIGIAWEGKGSPVEFLTLSKENGARLRATVSEFGPVLFSKILGLNDTQEGVVSIVFKYSDDNNLPLLDLKDFKKVMNYTTGEGKKEIEENYGKVSTATTSTILRKIIELEQQGAEIFFGEKSFEVDDLVRLDDNGKGIVSILRLTDIQDKPKLFSTFMLSMLAEIYSSFPEEGDADQPKLVIFIDEAHLIFEEASKALLDQIETIVKLIRSKGVGIFFCTQNPTDIPDDVLAQLGLKVQHALRAFTAKDRKQIKLTAENYPLSDFYDTETLITSLGMGEALVTVLSEKGNPTPLAATLLQAPRSRMDILTPQEIETINANSYLVKKYNEVIDRESAFEILSGKLKASSQPVPGQQTETVQNTTVQKPTEEEEPGMLSKGVGAVGDFVKSSTGKIIIREVTRGILGILGFSSTGRRRK
ncbi:MAG TPA: helicase HerA-like domain-containing protein, partial [Chitinophagales bacterium]|nr:helicase HerA-like domain-containing protein [Chitinophagales bacterium]